MCVCLCVCEENNLWRTIKRHKKITMRLVLIFDIRNNFYKKVYKVWLTRMYPSADTNKSDYFSYSTKNVIYRFMPFKPSHFWDGNVLTCGLYVHHVTFIYFILDRQTQVSWGSRVIRKVYLVRWLCYRVVKNCLKQTRLATKPCFGLPILRTCISFWLNFNESVVSLKHCVQYADFDVI